MVGKCANPRCEAIFRYLHEGRLFAIDVPSTTAPHPDGQDWTPWSRTVQYFWLCRECLPYMTIAYDPAKGKVVVRSRKDSAQLTESATYLNPELRSKKGGAYATATHAG